LSIDLLNFAVEVAQQAGAITLESNTALATYTREAMLYNKEDLLEPLGTATRGAALAWVPAARIVRGGAERCERRAEALRHSFEPC